MISIRRRSTGGSIERMLLLCSLFTLFGGDWVNARRIFLIGRSSGIFAAALIFPIQGIRNAGRPSAHLPPAGGNAMIHRLRFTLLKFLVCSLFLPSVYCFAFTGSRVPSRNESGANQVHSHGLQLSQSPDAQTPLTTATVNQQSGFLGQQHPAPPPPARPSRPQKRRAPERPAVPPAKPRPAEPPSKTPPQPEVPPSSRPAPTPPARPAERPAPPPPVRPAERPAPTPPANPSQRPAPPPPVRPEAKPPVEPQKLQPSPQNRKLETKRTPPSR